MNTEIKRNQKTIEEEIDVKSPTFLAPDKYLKILEDNDLHSNAEIYKKVLEISEAIKDAGGRALLVGGSVRDVYFGKIPKDYDLEIYGLESEKVEEIVSKFGKINDVGKSYGVLKVSFGQGIDIDVSLPRKDSKVQEGHKGFHTNTNPYLSIEEASKRRDFTMNALAADPLNCELFDFFGGLQDIKDKRLRITDKERFVEDPLRALRAFQFIGRFGLKLEEEDFKIIKELAPQVKLEPEDRIREEWKKLLTKSEHPSIGLSAGMALGILQEIHPQFPPLAETPQEPEWHPEGNAWIHTLMSVDWASELCDSVNLDENKKFTIILATLCHDLGKPETTELKDGRYISHGHEPAGEKPTREFLKSLNADNETTDKVIKLVVNHLAPSMLYISKEIKKEPVTDGAVRKLAKRIFPATIQELVLVAMADHMGRGPFTDPKFPEQLLLPDGYPAGPWLLKWARELSVEQSKPENVIMGKDLLNIGFKPGMEFGKIIELSNQLRDEKSMTRENILKIILNCKSSTEAIESLMQA